jgi:hypothetical protein
MSVKLTALLAIVTSSVLLSACCSVKNGIPCKTVTLENRRDMYFPQKVNGPYTRMRCEGIPKVEKEEKIPPSESGFGK